MNIVNFRNDLPTWGLHVNQTFSLESPMFIYQRENNSKYFPHLSLKCGDNCGAEMEIYYYGLNSYWPSERGSDEETIDFSPRYPKDGGENTNNISVDITNGEVLQKLNDFLTETPKAMNFKKELDKGFCAVVELQFKDYPEIRINVRREADKINFNLERISEKFSNVPLVGKAEKYRDALGIIYSAAPETDLSSLLVNDYGKLDDPIFKGVIDWLDLLGKENEVDLSLRKIWVRPYNR